MYEYIEGQVTFVSPYYIVLDNQGIGYQVAVANPFRYQVDETKKRVYIQQVIREDAHSLYGFISLDEKNLFLSLLRVSGIGPKSALAILASDDHAGLVQAIETGDAAYLVKFPGVGKKTAQQMILDLKGKLQELALSQDASAPKQPTKALQSTVSSGNIALDEALEALKALGYREAELKKVLPELKEIEGTTDEYLRQGLKLVMKK